MGNLYFGPDPVPAPTGVGEITKSGSARMEASCGVVSWVMDKQAAEQAAWQVRRKGRGRGHCSWGGIFTQLFAAFMELKL